MEPKTYVLEHGLTVPAVQTFKPPIQLYVEAVPKGESLSRRGVRVHSQHKLAGAFFRISLDVNDGPVYG